MTINKVILVGNLGADPETRTTQSGTVVAKLRIATTERQKDREGNWGDHTEWHRVTCFGKTAESVSRFLSKGRQVYIEGKLRTSKWQDRESGKDRYSTEVIADTVRFLGGGNRDGASGGGAGNSGGGSYGGGGGGGSYGGGNSGGGGGNSGGGGTGDGGGSTGGTSGGGYGGPPAGDDEIPF